MKIGKAYQKSDIPVAPWAFKCYCDGDLDVIQHWYGEQSKRVQAKFLSRLITLRQLPIQQWQLPPYRDLRGPLAGLGEIRFEADKVAYRILGFHQGATFFLVFAAQEKGGKFKPLSAPETSFARKAAIRKDSKNARELDWLSFE